VVEAHERRLVGGRFDVLETLGRGGMGVVYRALDRERGVDVALKTLRGVSPESVLRFKTEFRALRDLRHQNLVELGELFETDGTWFFTMELVRGLPFLRYVRGDITVADPVSSSVTSTGGALTRRDEDATSIDAPASVVARNAAARQRRIGRVSGPRCDIARLRGALGGLARGLAALHAAGKVHRDVKPSNILIDEHGRVVLLDFGIVAELRRETHREKQLVGTIKYMAPEQARGDAVGPAADWYAVGVLMFQALAGELPYGNVSPEELLVLKQHVDAPLVSDIVDQVPADLDMLANALLARDAAQRPHEHEILDTLGVTPDDDPSPPLPARDQLFVGRSAEITKLKEALEDSRKQLVTWIVEGESGVGKSSLAAQFVQLAHARDPRVIVLYGRCHERERVPFNALDGVVDDLTRFLLTQREARLERLVPDGVAPMLAVFPALRAVQVMADAAALSRRGADVRVRAFNALREVLVKLCRRRPTVMVIEDLQWADRDSVALLAELVRTDDEALRLCLIATKRTAEGDAIVRKLGKVKLMALGGLEPRDAEELVREIAEPQSDNIAKLIAETGGHPLFLRELARQPKTMRLEEAIVSRASRLDDGAQRVLAAVAAAGAPIPRHIACAAAGLAVADAEPHVAALTREGLVRVRGPRPNDPLEPFHDRIRQAIYDHQPAERQRELQHALARALEAAGAPAEQLLARYEAAGDPARAAHYIVPAAEAARAAFAFGRAAELFRRALDVPDLDAERRSTLLVQLGDTLANDGRTAEAAQRFAEAAALEPTDSERQLDLLRRAAERYLMAGRLSEGLATTRAVLERAGMTLPTTRTGTISRILWNQVRMRGSALHRRGSRAGARSLDADICWSIGAGLGMVDTLLGAYFSGRAARLALSGGNALQICRGMGAATIGACLLGRRARAERLLEACERAATEDGSRNAQWYLGLGRTGMSFMLDNDFARAHRDAVALESEWYAAGNGPGWETDVAMHFSLASQQMLGEFRDLARRVAMLVHHAKRNGDLFQEITLRVRFAVRHLLDGRTDEAREDVRDALAAWLPGTSSFGNQRAWGLWSRTRIALYSGRLDDEIDREWQRWDRSLIGRVPLMQTEAFHVWGTYLLARAIEAEQRGRPSEHASYVRAAERLAGKLDRLPFPAAPGSSGMLRAAIVWVRGGDRAAAAREGLETALGAGIPAFTAFFKRRLGEAIGGDEGAMLISQADDVALRAGWTDPQRGAELAIPTGLYG
jgi:eukaryotic-like serine/threonine-protein kinase